jgi:hypothetical protein
MNFKRGFFVCLVLKKIDTDLKSESFLIDLTLVIQYNL